MQDYEKAKELITELIRRSGVLSTYDEPRPESVVNLAQERLSVEFPKTYTRFLLEYGGGGIGPFEIFGVVQENLEHHSYIHLDVVWITLELREQWDLPMYLLPVYDLGNGELYCLDFRKREGDEVKVVAYDPGFKPSEQSYDIVSEDFGELFLDLARLALNTTKVD